MCSILGMRPFLLPGAVLQSKCTLRSVQKNGPNDFVLLVASADTRPDAVHDFSLGGTKAKLTVRYGDFAEPLSRVVKALTEVRHLSVLVDVPPTRSRRGGMLQMSIRAR